MTALRGKENILFSYSPGEGNPNIWDQILLEKTQNAKSKKVNLYQSAKLSLGERIRKKLFKKTSWFKEREREQESSPSR